MPREHSCIFESQVNNTVSRIFQITLLLATALVTTGPNAEDTDMPTEEWLEWSRPSIGFQLCEDPRAPFRVAFDGTTEECKAEVDRLFIKCATEVPNVRLPATLPNVEDQKAAGLVLYECVSSYYLGGATLEEFERRHPLEPPPEAGSGD
jgi:hypothetical protein